MMADHRKTKIPEHWVVDKIGNRIKVNYGRSQAAVRDVDGAIPVYGTGGLIEFARRHLYQDESVLLGRKGTLDNPIYLDHPFWPVDTTYYTSDFDGSMKWFYYVTQSLNLSLFSEATGVPSLSRDTFCRLEIPFPPVEEQIVIAEILTTVDQAIEQTEALIAKQRRIKAGLLHDLLTRGIDEHGNLRDPATHQFKESSVGLVPVEWEVSTVDSTISSAIDGPFGSNLKTEHYVSGDGVRVIRLQNIGIGRFDDIDKAYVSHQHAQRLARHQVLPGDILVAALGDSNHPIGRACLYPAQSAAINKADCFRLRLKQSLALHSYVVHVFNSQIMRRQLDSMGQGVTRERVNLSKIRSFAICLPSLSEQNLIRNILEDQDERVSHQEIKVEKLQRIKTGLMHDLLTGRVSVSSLARTTSLSDYAA